MRKSGLVSVDPLSVFLNIPFDKAYEPVFLGLVAGLVSFGLKPRSVLEVQEEGGGRMNRLYQLMASCRYSFHDVSRVKSLPARFNMPFELGIAYGLYQTTKDHSFIVLEEEKYRLQKTLSDLCMIDPRIHRGTGIGAIESVMDQFAIPSQSPPKPEAKIIYAELSRKRSALRDGKETLFSRVPFLNTIRTAWETRTAWHDMIS